MPAKGSPPVLGAIWWCAQPEWASVCKPQATALFSGSHVHGREEKIGSYPSRRSRCPTRDAVGLTGLAIEAITRAAPPAILDGPSLLEWRRERLHLRLSGYGGCQT
mmetsp:Transcript_15036/g.38780  ORF Transcript_15036/g.38780 Transcript_15036/m.38780 type:complete len:106 (-) Transcript_15036:279-596(-)